MTGIAARCCAHAAAEHAGPPGDPRDKLPPPHSITSSARARSVGGIARPASLAVLRLIARSNLRLLYRQVGRAWHP